MTTPDFHGQPLTDDPKPAGRFHRGADDTRLAIAALVQSHQALLDRLTGLESISQSLHALVSVPRNRVIWSGTAQINSGGYWHHRNLVTAKSIFVVNFSTNSSVTVVAGPPQGNAPGPGVGTHLLPAGACAVFNNDTSDWTIYGTAGNSVEVQILGVPVQPMAAGQI